MCLVTFKIYFCESTREPNIYSRNEKLQASEAVNIGNCLELISLVKQYGCPS